MMRTEEISPPRHAASELSPTSFSEQLRPDTYDGRTYYDLPAVKPSHWGKLIAGYFFVGGIAGGSQLLAQIGDLAGDEDDRRLVAHGRYLALAGSVISPVLLIADLHVPQRWFNMLRIFRPTSTMNLGAWTLTFFGTTSGTVAALQVLYDLTGDRRFERLARICGMPAAASGCVLSIYTGTLLAATSTPLWAAAGNWLPVLFGASAMTTSAAALSLAQQAAGEEGSLPRLEKIAAVSAATELVVGQVIDHRWRQTGTRGAIDEQPARAAWNLGFKLLGAALPLAIHGVAAFTGRRSRRASLLASAAALVGGYVLRQTLISAGRTSGKRPQDYFRFAQTKPGPEHHPERSFSPSRPQRVERRRSEQDGEPDHAVPQSPFDPLALFGETREAADQSLGYLRQRAIVMLDDALQKPVQQLLDELDKVEAVLVIIRNRLISARRRGESPANDIDDALLTVNMALSAIVGVEFPSAGVQRKVLERARDTLRELPPSVNELR